VVRFLARPPLDTKDLKLPAEWSPRQSTSTENHSARIEIPEKVIEKNKSTRFSLIPRQSSKRSAPEYHERSDDSYLNQKSTKYSEQKRRAQFEQNLDVKSERNRENSYHYQSKYQYPSKMNKYPSEPFTRYFSESIQQRQNFRHRQTVDFDHYDGPQRNFRQRSYDVDPTFVPRENRKLQSVSLTHDYEYGPENDLSRNYRRKVKSDLYTEIPIRMKTSNGSFATFTEEFHILNDVPCPIVVETNLMKPFNIRPDWEQRNLPDSVIIQRTHVIEMKATLPPKPKELTLSIRNLPDLSTKMKSLRPPRRKSTNVYAVSSHILEPEHGKNVEVTHRPLAKATYQ
jgi:hypothetical protein